MFDHRQSNHPCKHIYNFIGYQCIVSSNATCSETASPPNYFTVLKCFFLVCWSLTMQSVNTVSKFGAIVFHFTFIYFRKLSAYTSFIFFVSRMTKTMKFWFWQGETIRWSTTGIICTNIACTVKSINSTNWIESSEFRRWTFAISQLKGQFLRPFCISFVFTKNRYHI